MSKGNKGKAQAAEAPKEDSQLLPSKEANLFKQTLKFYETKQYKKGVKAADQVLKRFPNHGETLAMKGLILNCLGKKEEARQFVKKGVSLNLKSHVSWHVYGLLYRSDHQYEDAIKCYQNALRIDPENLQILKDLSLLQIQRRQIEGFQETRRKILVLKSNNRNNWTAFAIGNHLAENYKGCLSVLESYQKTTEGQDKGAKYEVSEMKLYTNMVIEESGDVEGALKHLNENEAEILDKPYLKAKRASLNTKLGNLKAAEAEYRDLIAIQPETYSYHTGLRETLGLVPSKDGTFTPEQERGVVELYKELSSKQPRAAAHRRLPLDLLNGEEFKKLVDQYLVDNLRKGIPALFKDLRQLYSCKGKVDIIEGLLLGYLEELRTNLRFHSSQEPGSEVPSALIWTLYFTGHHYDHLRQSDKALEIVEESLKHTPTNIDTYVLKARIYKHLRDHTTAYHYMDEARKLDTQDRYLNTKAVRYAFRAEQVEKAEETVTLFLREGDSLSSMKEMQVMWYELAAGDSHMRQKHYGKALKQYLSVEKHFEDFREDQFDFHTYCLRKMTLRAYVNMLRWEDNLKSHRFFHRAAQQGIKVYLRLYDAPREQDGEIEAQDNLSAEEKKRLQKQKKRQAAKAASATKTEEKEEKKVVEKNRFGKPKEVDEDPKGEKLAAVEDPLGQAARLVKEMQLYSPSKVQTHLCALEVYSRRNKPLLVLQALKKVAALSADHPLLHLHALTFWHNVGKATNLHPVTKAVIDAERKNSQYGASGANLEAINASFLKSHADSIPHRIAAAKAALVLDPKNRARVVEILTSAPLQYVSVEEVEEAADFAATARVEAEVLSVFHKAFPQTPRFFSAEQREQHKAKVAALAEPLVA